MGVFEIAGDIIFASIIALWLTLMVELFRRKRSLEDELQPKNKGQRYEYIIYYKGYVRAVRYSDICYSPAEIVVWVIENYGIEEWDEYEVVVKERY